MKIAILSNVNLDMLIQSVKKQHNVFDAEGYGQWIPYALNRDSRLFDWGPEAIFLILDGNALLESFDELNAGITELKQAATYVGQLGSCYPNSIIAVSTIDVIPNRLIAGDARPIEDEWSYLWEKGLDEIIASHANIHRFELKHIIVDFGRKNIYSDKLWYMGSIPFAIKSIPVLSSAINDFIEKLFIARKKVLVLDLDNTLWGGVLGEDGPQGVTLGRSLLGAAYQDAQKRIKEVSKTGILLAIVSKNNIDDVNSIFIENTHMILQEKDFVFIAANWNSKVENIKNIASQLNLGLDSFVFLDDNEVERESVRLNLPEVTIAEFPSDIANLPKSIRTLYNRYFWLWRQTQEDTARTELYHQEAMRQKDLNNMASMEDFLISLKIDIELSELRDDTTERIVQLTNKTNQFNTNTLRMDLTQLVEYQCKPGNHVISANVSDKYGDSGLVAAIFVQVENKTAFIDNFLMSCRVMGRQIENAIVWALVQKLKAKGVKLIRASYVRTKKNAPVEKLWESLGFSLIDGNSEVKDYRINLDEVEFIAPIIKPRWR